jgi:hypothetical protein
MIEQTEKQEISQPTIKPSTTEISQIKNYRWTQDRFGNWALEKVMKDEKKEEEREEGRSADKSENNVIDNTERVKQDSYVMTEWGIGKVKKLENGIATVLIEGNPAEFPKEMLPTSLPVYLCILCKDMTYWVSLKVEFFYNIGILKSKIAQFMQCHHSQIVLVHSGAKIDKKTVSIMELGVYENDVILALIKDPQELQIFR